MTNTHAAAAATAELAELTSSPQVAALAFLLHAIAHRHHLVPSLLHTLRRTK